MEELQTCTSHVLSWYFLIFLGHLQGIAILHHIGSLYCLELSSHHLHTMGSIATPHRPLEIGIVGGGIAGLTLAIGLLRRGLQVKIYERGRSFREIGAGIGFTQNAEWAMKVLDPEIHQAFKRVTVQNGTDWFMWMDGEYYDEDAEDAEKREKLIHKLYLGERGFEGCHRADFLDELVSLLPAGCVEFDRNLASIADDTQDDKVKLCFTDGSSVEADAGTRLTP